MYKVLLADDESIVIEALRFIIEKKYGEECEIQTARTGRSVIELAETFRPDIAFMDIQMPGINGIEAMKEIKGFNSSVIFIVMTAYDRFDYAKEAIDLGVLEYLSKPVTREKIEKALQKAMGIIDDRRKKRSSDLLIKEKLEIVVPFIEAGLIYSLLLGDDSPSTVDKYKELLNIRDQFAYVVVLEAADDEDAQDTNEVGNGVRLEKYYEQIRSSIKDNLECIVGPIMGNRLVILMPFHKASMEYAERAVAIENIRSVVHEVENFIDMDLRSGVGVVKEWDRLMESYNGAMQALRIGVGAVSHANDLELGCKWENDYPVDTEHRLFEAVGRGDTGEVALEADNFYGWMMATYSDRMEDVRMKVIDFVLWAEHVAYEKGNMTYHFTSRTGYLEAVTGSDKDELRLWFLDKMKEAADNVNRAKDEALKSPVKKALDYIRDNYSQDLSLDQISQMVDVTPYYFSKLFKKEQGVNFIDYLTDLRISKAKELLVDERYSVKEVCSMVGYMDPNYFSRIFKKNVGCSPSEYKDGMRP